MEKFLNRSVVMTFLYPVGFPDGSAANLVEGVITGHNDKEDSITICGITICYRTNPLMSICLGAAEQYNEPRRYPLNATYLPAKEGGESASVVIETTFEDVVYMIEFDGKGNIGGLVKIEGERKGWDFYFNEEDKA